jgi:DTW domain-containing protein
VSGGEGPRPIAQGMNAEEVRAVCARCRRPEVVCYCRFVTPLTTRTRVVLLQHPRERDVPINTARIAALCLPSAELRVGVTFDASMLADPERPAALLWPGSDAIDISVAPPEKPITLVVVDGTWWQARKLVRQNPTLARLPRYAFRPEHPSAYRIRKEPQQEYVSTIEALVHVLGILEGDRERFAAMLVPFRAMVDAQLAFAAQGRGRHRLRERKPKREPSDPRTRMPAVLRERPEDLVCVHGEANGWPYRSAERKTAREELVQWVAYRMTTGESFEAFVAPERELAPHTAHHLRVDPNRIQAGGTRAELLHAWKEFVRPNDVVCAWGTYGPRLLKEIGGSLGSSFVDLRNAAHVMASAKLGTIEAYFEPFGIELPREDEIVCAGRAGKRLAQVVALVRSFTSGSADPA